MNFPSLKEENLALIVREAGKKDLIVGCFNSKNTEYEGLRGKELSLSALVSPSLKKQIQKEDMNNLEILDILLGTRG